MDLVRDLSPQGRIGRRPSGTALLDLPADPWAAPAPRLPAAALQERPRSGLVATGVGIAAVAVLAGAWFVVRDRGGDASPEDAAASRDVGEPEQSVPDADTPSADASVRATEGSVADPTPTTTPTEPSQTTSPPTSPETTLPESTPPADEGAGVSTTVADGEPIDEPSSPDQPRSPPPVPDEPAGGDTPGASADTLALAVERAGFEALEIADVDEAEGLVMFGGAVSTMDDIASVEAAAADAGFELIDVDEVVVRDIVYDLDDALTDAGFTGLEVTATTVVVEVTGEVADVGDEASVLETVEAALALEMLGQDVLVALDVAALPFTGPTDAVWALVAVLLIGGGTVLVRYAASADTPAEVPMPAADPPLAPLAPGPDGQLCFQGRSGSGFVPRPIRSTCTYRRPPTSARQHGRHPGPTSAAQHARHSRCANRAQISRFLIGCGRSTVTSSQHAPVAQLDRASDYGSGGWEFESLRACGNPSGSLELLRNSGYHGRNRCSLGAWQRRGLGCFENPADSRRRAASRSNSLSGDPFAWDPLGWEPFGFLGVASQLLVLGRNPCASQLERDPFGWEPFGFLGVASQLWVSRAKPLRFATLGSRAKPLRFATLPRRTRTSS